MNKKLTLKDLGAENCNNLLHPIYCECGCGSYAYAIIETEQDAVNLAGGLLEDVDCNNAMIFVMMDNNVCGAYTSEDGVYAFKMMQEDGNDSIMGFEDQVRLIKSMVEELEIHCIGVFQSVGDNHYRVIMEDVYEDYDDYDRGYDYIERSPYIQ